jgi:hypothetical protein
MVGKIADCCDDGKLRRLIEGTPEYAELVDEEISYQGKDGRKRWNDLGRTISETWERAIGYVEAWLEWVGDFEQAEFEGDDIWGRVGARPITLVFKDAEYLTVRARVPVRGEEEETEVAFLGGDGEVAVFTDVVGLALYCRTAKDHALRKLEWWSELAEVEEDDEFAPSDNARYDLRKPSSAGADLLRELADFCDLDADTDVLDGPTVDRDDWADLVTEVRTCFSVE